MTHKIKLPEIDVERQSRHAILTLIASVQQPMYLPCVIEAIEVTESRYSGLPVIKLELRVHPEEALPKLVPFKLNLNRIIRAPLNIDDSFDFEDVLGKVQIPWGKELDIHKVLVVFKSWLGKSALVKIDITVFQDERLIHAVDLRKVPTPK